MPSFKWDLENAWQLEHYEEARTPEQVQALVRLVKERRIGVAALYLNILTGACTAESFNRCALGAATLRRRFGIATPQAILTDVPSAVGTLPTVLARSGIRYFAQGINQTRAPYYADPAAPPMPFWWEGPDGGRVLTWLSNSGYANAAHFQIVSGVETALQHVGPWIEGFEKKNYPYDALLLYGGVSDNQPLDPRYARVIDEWNRRYAWPRLLLAAQGEFFEYMEKRWGDRIPVLRGDNGSYWEDGAASSAYETTLNRRSQEDIVTAEKLFGFNALLGDARPYPAAEFARQWSNIFFYIEHTWGAHNSISQPDVEFVRKQWLFKANYAREPAVVLGPMVRDGLEALGRRVRTGDTPAALVFNPLSWNRLDVVRVELPEHLRGRAWTATRGSTGEALPTQRVDENTLAFTSSADTGGIGYETYPLVGAQHAAPQPVAVTRPDDRTIENRFYTISIDPQTGGIASLFDKELGRELIDPEAPYRAGEYLYVAGGENTRLHEASAHLPMPRLKEKRPEAVAVRPGADGPVFGSLVIETKNEVTPKIATEIILYRDVKRVDLAVRLTKQETTAKEGVYFPFPFNLRNPDVRLEIPDGVIRPEKDQFGGGCRDWYAVQHWIELAQPGANPWRVTFSAPDTLLVCLNDIFRGRWMKKGELRVDTGLIFVWAMNNYWFTNYKAGQGGDFEFRFSITSDAGGPDDVAAARFGWGAANPLLGAVLPSRQQGALPGALAFVTADRPNAAVTAFKRAEAGDGWIVRLLDLNGGGGPVKLSFPAFAFREAVLTNLVEEPLHPLPLDAGAVAVPLDKRGLATVKLR
jgi:alpha-mannosidase